MRCPAVVLSIALLLSATAFAEDAQLRATAIEMVEHSLQVSFPALSAPVPNETVLTFQARGADGTMRPGSYTRVYAGPGRVREEFTFGDFHLVQISLSDRRAFIGGSRVLPPEARLMLTLVPIQLWHLDHEDVIKNIVQSSRGGQAAACVQFDTIRGAEKNANELCFDATTGAQVYNRTGNVELLNSEFFDFAGAKLPGHIQQSRNGELVMDIHLTRKVITDPVSEDMFTPPAGADVGIRCQSYRRAFGQSMPQPAGNGGTLTNVFVHGVIGIDGRVHNAVVESSDRPDLNDDALKVVQAWTFTPAMCNGNPNPQEATLVVRFQGR
jgi:TonB family protein